MKNGLVQLALNPFLHGTSKTRNLGFRYPSLHYSHYNNFFRYIGTMSKNGFPDGFCRVISPDGDLDFYGCFVNGSLIGNCWKGLLGGEYF